MPASFEGAPGIRSKTPPYLRLGPFRGCTLAGQLEFFMDPEIGNFKGPRGPLKGPRGPFKGPRVSFKGPRGPFKGPRGPFKGTRGPFKGVRGVGAPQGSPQGYETAPVS